MILRRARALRPGTARYTITGIDGLADDDRAVASVWPRPGGVTILVTIGGDRQVSRIDLETALTPETLPAATVRTSAETLLRALTG